MSAYAQETTMITDDEKEALIEKWYNADAETQNSLMYQYLLTMTPRQGQNGWLLFLQHQFGAKLCINT